MSISDEDKALFRQAVKNITRQTTSAPTTHASKISIYLSSTYHTTFGPESALFYCQSHIARAQFNQFKKGQLTIQAKLDLHGLNADQAATALIQFISDADAAQRRVLLVIHGKGKTQEISVLKNLVNHWLPQFPQVLAFISAQPKDGGMGAVYVLLKNKV